MVAARGTRLTSRTPLRNSQTFVVLTRFNDDRRSLPGALQGRQWIRRAPTTTFASAEHAWEQASQAGAPIRDGDASAATRGNAAATATISTGR